MLIRTAMVFVASVCVVACDISAVPEDHLDSAVSTAVSHIIATEARHPVDAFDPRGLPVGISAVHVATRSGLDLEDVTLNCDPNPCRAEPANVDVWVWIDEFAVHRGDSVTIEVWLEDFAGRIPVTVSYLVDLVHEGDDRWRVIETRKNAEV